MKNEALKTLGEIDGLTTELQTGLKAFDLIRESLEEAVEDLENGIQENQSDIAAALFVKKFESISAAFQVYKQSMTTSCESLEEKTAAAITATMAADQATGTAQDRRQAIEQERQNWNEKARTANRAAFFAAQGREPQDEQELTAWVTMVKMQAARA